MSHLPGLSHFKNIKATLCNEDMSVLYPKACPGSHRSRALALWLPQCRGDLPSNIPHTTPSSRFKNRTVQYSTFIRLYWYISREFRTRFARLMPCTIPSDSPAINFVSKRPWQTFLQTAIMATDVRKVFFSYNWKRQNVRRTLHLSYLVSRRLVRRLSFYLA